MGRKDASYFIKRYKTSYRKSAPSANKTGDTKSKSFATTAGIGNGYFTLTNIQTGGTNEERIANRLYIRNIKVQSHYLPTSTGVAFRVMLVQSRVGNLAGTNGDSDAPSYGGRTETDKYRVLHDQLYPTQLPAVNQGSTVVDFNVKVNRMVRYKGSGSTDYNMDMPIYLWFIGYGSTIATAQIDGHAQIYFNDV